MSSIRWNTGAIDSMIQDAKTKAGSELQSAFDEVHRAFAAGGDEAAVRTSLSSAMGHRGLNAQAPFDPEMNATIVALARGERVIVRTT